MFKWLPGSGNSSKTDSSPGRMNKQETTIIHPVLWEYRDHNLVVQDSEQEAIDDATLDKLENYYYKDADEQQIITFLYERVPKKLEDMHVDYFEERMGSLEGMLQALDNKLTRKTAANYDKFCVGIQTVSDIKQIVMKQSEQFSVAKAKHDEMKEFWAYKVQRLLAAKRKLDKQKSVLVELEFLKEKIGWLLEAYKEGLDIEKESTEPEVRYRKTRQLLVQVEKFRAEDKSITTAVKTKNSKFVSMIDRARKIADRGNII